MNTCNEIYWINDFKKGSLALMPHPKSECLKDKILFLKKIKINTLVCLLEDKEIQALQIEKEAFYCQENQIEFIHFPIADFCLPNEQEYLQLLQTLNSQLKNNKNIVIHCRAGIGRTATLAAGLVIKNKLTEKDVFDYLSEKRKTKVPDTDQQKNWVYKMSESILKD